MQKNTNKLVLNLLGLLLLTAAAMKSESRMPPKKPKPRSDTGQLASKLREGFSTENTLDISSALPGRTKQKNHKIFNRN